MTRLTATAVACLLLASGCESAPGIELLQWSLSNNQSPVTQPVTLPAHFDLREPRPAAYVLSRREALPADWRGQRLTLTFAKLGAPATLKVNGREAVPLDADTWAAYRVAGPQSFRLSPEMTASGTVELELTLNNTWTQSAWVDVVPRLSATDAGEQPFRFQRDWNRITAVFGLTAALVSALLFGSLYLFNRKRSDTGWFVVEAVCGAMYPALNLNILQPILGDLDVPLAAMAVAGAGVAGVHMMHAFLKRPPPSALWRYLWVAQALVSVAFRDPFHATQFGATTGALFLAVAAVYMVVGFARAARVSAIPGALTLSLGWVGVIALGGIDIVGWLGFGRLAGGWQGAGLAIFSIAVAQAVNLSREHVLALREAETLNVELKARLAALEASNREVGVLNDELRHQIKTRSMELANSFSKDSGVKGAVSADLAPGDVVNDRYRIESVLGSGGMGVVYRATRVSDGRQCALKIIKHRRTNDQLARMSREAMVLAEIVHPNVIGVYDINVSGSGQLYIVMELVEGESLDKKSAQFGALEFGLPVLQQTASALEAIHSRGFIHRDLKPANILCAQKPGEVPRIKVVDFGLAGLLDTEVPAILKLASTIGNLSTLESPAHRSLTQTGAILGTPLYMAPEFVAGTKEIGPPADIFSFGIIAYEVLGGRRPFKELPIAAAVQGRQLWPEVALEELCKGLRPELGVKLRRCLDARPEARPSAKELVTELRGSVS